MKKNIFKTIFGGFFSLIKTILFYVFYIIAFPFAYIIFRSKVKGKENLQKTDEARVFVANHYEIYGPFIAHMHFPYNYRPWIIDKMIDPKTVEQHMSIGIYQQFPKYPRWLKTVVIKLLKNIMVFFMKNIGKGIPVSRDDFRKNIKTMQISTETLEKGKSILIFPEASAVKEGKQERIKSINNKYERQLILKGAAPENLNILFNLENEENVGVHAKKVDDIKYSLQDGEYAIITLGPL